ncbi:MAG: VOC family protein [Nitrospirota bacterium]|nr:MAG: VOC family protein [Nitrospirota bacterium]
MPHAIFHLAFPVKDLEETKTFYVEGLGCSLGRESHVAVTLELGGNQIIAHLSKHPPDPPQSIYPRHFGLVLESEMEWQILADRAKAKNLKFYREPSRRYQGTRIEHRTFFLEDPSHNLLEFKYYTYPSAIFEEQDFASVGEDHEQE